MVHTQTSHVALLLLSCCTWQAFCLPGGRGRLAKHLESAGVRLDHELGHLAKQLHSDKAELSPRERRKALKRSPNPPLVVEEQESGEDQEAIAKWCAAERDDAVQMRDEASQSGWEPLTSGEADPIMVAFASEDNDTEALEDSANADEEDEHDEEQEEDPSNLADFEQLDAYKSKDVPWFMNDSFVDPSLREELLQRAFASETVGDHEDVEELGASCKNGQSLTKDEVKYLQCPPGSYMKAQSATDRKKLAKRLQTAVCLMKKKGWKSGNSRETDYYKKRGYATFESRLFPKDPTCKKLPHESYVKQSKAIPYRIDEAPPYSKNFVNSHYKNAEFHKIWKVASSAFTDYLQCEYAGTWKEVSVDTPVKKGAKVVAAVRNPLTRWVSAVGELLERSVNGICPAGKCKAADGFVKKKTLPMIEKTTTWYKLIKSGYNKKKADDVVRAFVHDTACNYHTYAIEHLTTQSTFITQNPGPAHKLGPVVKLERIADDGLSKLSKAIRGTSKNKCKLAAENAQKCKANGSKIPDSDTIMKVLSDNPEWMKKLCLVYAQDFICFDYDLPEPCKGLF